VKIAYMHRGRPESVARLPDEPDIEKVIVEGSTDGTYTPEMLAPLADVEALYVFNGTVNEAVFAAAPKLRIVQRGGVGYDSIDLEAAKRHNVFVCNNAGNNAVKVAEHCLMMMLALGTHIFPVHELTREARWQEARAYSKVNFELRGRTLGIVGLGNIGSNLARRAKALEMPVVYNDIRDIDPEVLEATGARFKSKEELFASSDFISINTPLTPETRNMIDAKALALMKPSAFLICAARGNIVDEAALRQALDEERLAGAGIDVFSVEPLEKDNPLLGAKNIILSSHLAGVGVDTSERGRKRAHDNIRRCLIQGLEPENIVNP